MNLSRARSLLEIALLIAAALVLASYAGVIVISFSYAYGGYPLVLIVLAAIAFVTFLLFRHQHRSSTRSSESELAWPHRGILVNKISPAGLPGLAFALGVTFMFWFGIPAYRPIVIGALLAGVIAGVVLIRLHSRAG